MFISLKNIKYIKLCIVSPAYEIIINLSIIVLFFTISFLIQSQGIQMTNYQLTELISDTFKEQDFRSIKTKQEYYNYIKFLVDKLYEYDPPNNDNSIPYYIPYGAIRLKKFSNKGCIDKYNELRNINCQTDECTLDLLNNFYSNKECGASFIREKGDITNASKIEFARRFEGKYSSYNLVKEGINLDFTIDEYYANINSTKDFIETTFIESDDDIKFIALLFNVYFPYDDSHAIIIAGIEMINSHVNFNEPFFIFNSSILNKMENKNKGFFAVLILYAIAVALSFIKIIYEMNVKLIIPTHFIEFADSACNLVLLVFIYLYLGSLENIPIIETKDNSFINDNIYLKNYHDFYAVLSLRGYVVLILSIIFLSMPIRLMSLLSWSSFISKPLIQYFSVLFRMLPGLVVNSLVTICSLIPAVFLNYFFYHSKILNYDTIFSSILFFTNIFQDIVTIKEEEDENKGYSIKHSISDTEYILLFGVIQKLIFLYSYICFISSCVNSFEKAIQYESKKEDDEVLKKMEEIEGILEKEEENNDDSLSNLKKQILWVNFENNNDLYNEVFGKMKNMLLFKNANQVISFLKYLFALKPLMQFKSLKHKLCIVMQYSSYKDNNGIKERIIENIRALLEWLNFVGCKIPVIIYCENNFGFLQKIQVSTSYKLLTFTDNLNSIEKFINEEFEEDDNKNNDFQIVHVNKFTLYKVNYVIVKQSKKHKKDDEDEDSEKDSVDEDNKLLDHEQSFIKSGQSKLRLNINDNEEGEEEDNKVNSRNEDSSLVSKSSYSSSSTKKNNSKK